MNMTGGSEFLNWENWDVKKYKGTEAILQIVDQASGGWSHIHVDQISPAIHRRTRLLDRPGAADRLLN